MHLTSKLIFRLLIAFSKSPHIYIMHVIYLKFNVSLKNKKKFKKRQCSYMTNIYWLSNHQHKQFNKSHCFNIATNIDVYMKSEFKSLFTITLRGLEKTTIRTERLKSSLTSRRHYRKQKVIKTNTNIVYRFCYCW